MKKLGFILGTILLGIFIYLFAYPYNYHVSFEAKTFPGTINQIIKTWSNTLENSEILGQNGIYQVTQQIQFGDSTHIYEWNIQPIHDSLSKVKVYAKDKYNSLGNKLSVPFYDTNFEKRTRHTLIDFNQKLADHIKNFKVEIVGEDATKTTFCACTKVKTTQYGKADGMIRDFPLLNSFLLKNKIELNGPPFLEVINWQKENDSLDFKFCFPMIQMDILPEHPELEYRNYYGRKALKAVYNGNYITSDRAWYALIDYADKNDIEIEKLPVEVFFNNPNMIGNATNWKAEIYMPLKGKFND
jgi:effector-binding domain-containing protein